MGTEFLILSTTELYPIKVVKMRISLLVQWLRLFAPTAGAAGLILEQETKISHAEWRGQKKDQQAHFSSMYTKIGRIERRLAWPLHKDDMQMPESFHVKKKKRKKKIERGAQWIQGNHKSPQGMPCGSVANNLPANAGDMGSIPDPR